MVRIRTVSYAYIAVAGERGVKNSKFGAAQKWERDTKVAKFKSGRAEPLYSVRSRARALISIRDLNVRETSWLTAPEWDSLSWSIPHQYPKFLRSGVISYSQARYNRTARIGQFCRL